VNRTRVKICGLKTQEDVNAAVQAGADAVGFVFADSVRRVSFDAVEEIVSSTPAFVSTVAVFGPARHSDIRGVIDPALFDHIQLDAESYLDQNSGLSDMTYRLLPVVRAGSPLFAGMPRALPMGLRAVVIEGPRSGAGATIDWPAVAPLARQRRIILAGGLTPNNVAEAIRTVRPYGVDVSSGVESSPGKKDPIKIRDFIQAVRAVEREP
jgi:phosphoribosylanthranilate isomerase